MAKKIKHVFGNRIELHIPLTEREVTVNDGSVITDDISLVPQGNVSVRFSKGYGSYNFDVPATIEDNSVVMVDDGTIPIGTWAVEVVGTTTGRSGRPFRFKRNVILEVVDATEDGGDYANNETDVIAYYPVINGRSSAVVITDEEVILQVGGHIATDDDGDDEATVNADYGAGSITETDDEIIINI